MAEKNTEKPPPSTEGVTNDIGPDAVSAKTKERRKRYRKNVMGTRRPAAAFRIWAETRLLEAADEANEKPLKDWEGKMLMEAFDRGLLELPVASSRRAAAAKAAAEKPGKNPTPKSQPNTGDPAGGDDGELPNGAPAALPNGFKSPHIGRGIAPPAIPGGASGGTLTGFRQPVNINALPKAATDISDADPPRQIDARSIAARIAKA